MRFLSLFDKMLDALFGWRKASKCKKQIEMVRCRLKLVKNKRLCIAQQSRDDIAQLLKHAHLRIAFQRVEQVIKDESLVQAYHLLDLYCEFLMFSLPYIRKCRDCPNDINEAASTLIYASSRFGELPELMPIRKLFGERYGQRFVKNALELLPGNLVNLHMRENYFFAKKVPEDSKYRLLAEIGGGQQGLLLLENNETDKDHKLVSVISHSGPHHTPADDVEEFVSSALDDQRLFVFRLFDEKECYKLPKNSNDDEKRDARRDSYNDSFLISKMDGRKEGEQIANGHSGLSVAAERWKQSFEDGRMMGQISFPQCPNIHPKLPDYDEVAEKFKALKSESLGKGRAV